MGDYIDYSDRTIPGFCPMGCGATLFVGSGGHITCSCIPCPNPAAVDLILADATVGHIVVLDEFDFKIQHPLRERLDGELFDCPFNLYMSEQTGPPVPPGRYLVMASTAENTWVWTPAVSKQDAATEE
jgi:hypothetical protein